MEVKATIKNNDLNNQKIGCLYERKQTPISPCEKLKVEIDKLYTEMKNYKTPKITENQVTEMALH